MSLSEFPLNVLVLAAAAYLFVQALPVLLRVLVCLFVLVAALCEAAHGRFVRWFGKGG